MHSGWFPRINSSNHQEWSIESIRKGSYAYTLPSLSAVEPVKNHIPKNALGKRERETAGVSGELLIADDFLVARLGLGTMRLTGKGIWGEPSDRSEAIRVVRRAVELGVNFIDTADSYGPEVSEEIIAGSVSLSGRRRCRDEGKPRATGP